MSQATSVAFNGLCIKHTFCSAMLLLPMTLAADCRTVSPGGCVTQEGQEADVNSNCWLKSSWWRCCLLGGRGGRTGSQQRLVCSVHQVLRGCVTCPRSRSERRDHQRSREVLTPNPYFFSTGSAFIDKHETKQKHPWFFKSRSSV